MILLLVAAYCLQLMVVGYWRLFPVNQAHENGKTYTIIRGRTDSIDFIPLLAMVALQGDATLVVRDDSSGLATRETFDFVDEIYSLHHELFGIELEDWQKAR
ncbi:hypothetical protein OVA24_16835 [Luteolibacter sp. SL250]|uniref:hypothetical protein n=1 Tax=Luteolibacter sp. SL250 TaxID=2995170 RepID=UPI00227174EB|nr:hypothetical protein [Luteolibacter sp. SL250]WAC18899.1 hypothetical protein OVA24_16835 [Luteolibacter sp. SL250]